MQGNKYGPITSTYGPNDIDTENFLYFKNVILGNSFGRDRGRNVFGIQRKDLRETNQDFRDHFNCEATDKSNQFTKTELAFRNNVEDEFYDIKDALIEIVRKNLRVGERFNVKEACDTSLKIIEQKKQEYSDMLNAESSDITTLSKAKIIHPALIEVEAMLELFRDLAAQKAYLTANDLWMLEDVPTDQLSLSVIEDLWQQCDDNGIITKQAAEELANG